MIGSSGHKKESMAQGSTFLHNPVLLYVFITIKVKISLWQCLIQSSTIPRTLYIETNIYYLSDNEFYNRQVCSGYRAMFDDANYAKQWGTCLPENPTDVAPIDHTERRHDVTFISVDVETQKNRCAIFYRILAKENTVYMSFEFSSEKLMRYRELCIDAQNPSKSFQNKSHTCHSVLFWDKNWKQPQKMESSVWTMPAPRSG
jgi:hypothetical protein